MDDSSLKSIVNLMSVKMFPAGEPVTEFDEIGDSFYYVLSGELFKTVPSNLDKYFEIKEKIAKIQSELDKIKKVLRGMNVDKEAYEKRKYEKLN